MENKVYYNPDYETYEYVHPDGYIEPFRDEREAQKFAEENGVVFEERNRYGSKD